MTFGFLYCDISRFRQNLVFAIVMVRGCENDLAEDIKWYKKAAEQEVYGARDALAYLETG